MRFKTGEVSLKQRCNPEMDGHGRSALAYLFLINLDYECYFGKDKALSEMSFLRNTVDRIRTETLTRQARVLLHTS